MTSTGRAFLLTAALLCALPARAIDGGFAATAEETSYYEQTADPDALAAATADGAASGGLPSALHVVEAKGGVRYRSLGNGSFEVSIEVASRPHERVDAVYDLVLALPLPLGSKTGAWRIAPSVDPTPGAPPVVYGGEPVVLKRNVPLESAWLPHLVGQANGLPDLSRSGLAWTLWDTIVRYDANAGASLQAFGRFRFNAEGAVVPDPENPDHAAYVITWIPTLEDVPPFAIRLDVVGAEAE
jgi:hypothetical protein